MIRSMSYNRNFKIPNPMLTGSANAPTATSTETVLPVGPDEPGQPAGTHPTSDGDHRFIVASMASRPAGLVAVDCGDEAVGVVEADDQ
jgi:hypothetical protein